MLTSVLVVLAAYAIGAVPVAFLTGKLLRGVDLRLTGSRNVGASNVWQTVSKAAVVPVGLTEIAQGLAGILIAKALDESLTVQVLAGLAALAAHNWSPFLRFAGGRGVGHAIGFMLVLSWPGLGALTGLSLVGVVTQAVPQFVGLGILAAPFAALVAGQATEIAAGLFGVAALIFAKRLLTNEPGIPPGHDPGEVLVTRLLSDRDTPDRESWVRRGADGE